MAHAEDTNEPMVGGPYRPVQSTEGATGKLKGYWIENEKGIHFTNTRFYQENEFDEAVTLCKLLNAAYQDGAGS